MACLLMEEWGGVNEVIPLHNGKLGILKHIARWSPRKNPGIKVRNYYPATFIFDPYNLYATPVRIVLERLDLPNGLNGAAKRPDLINVLFPGGILRNGNGTATIFIGAGDAEVYSIRIRDPFLKTSSLSKT